MMVSTLESTEQTLRLTQGLLERVVRQNERYPGAGAAKRDLSHAKRLLQEMVNLLSELISQVSVDVADNQDFARAKEAQKAYSQAASLISCIYDDIREAHTALEDGITQSPSIGQAEIHLERLVKHCQQARDLLEDPEVAP